MACGTPQYDISVRIEKVDPWFEKMALREDHHHIYMIHCSCNATGDVSKTDTDKTRNKMNQF